MSKETVACYRKDKGCTGVLVREEGFALRTGCTSCTQVYPCSECGRVCTISADNVAVGMQRRSGEDVYLVEGMLECKDPENTDE